RRRATTYSASDFRQSSRPILRSGTGRPDATPGGDGPRPSSSGCDRISRTESRSPDRTAGKAKLASERNPNRESRWARSRLPAAYPAALFGNAGGREKRRRQERTPRARRPTAPTRTSQRQRRKSLIFASPSRRHDDFMRSAARLEWSSQALSKTRRRGVRVA